MAMSNFFGGKDPFDDPFFTQPFGGMFVGKNPFSQPFFDNPFDTRGGSRKEITIEELDNDGNAHELSKPSNEVVVKNPNRSSDHQDFSDVTNSLSYRRVAYGGVNGMYYSSSVGRRTGGDGVVYLEIKEEDKTVGQELHTISRGIHEKGHTLTKKRNPDGQEDSMQILHNLNEDELTSFEEAWKANADTHLPGWSNGFSFPEDPDFSSNGIWGKWALPWTELSGTDGAMIPVDETKASSSNGRKAKKIVRVNID